MGKVVWCAQTLAWALGMGGQWRALAGTASLEQQRAVWQSMWLVRLLRALPAWLLGLVADLTALLFFNRIVLWFGGGIPLRQ